MSVRLPRPVAAALAVALAVPLLAACTSTVSLTPAADANTVACADVVVHLPKSLGAGLSMRDTDAQGTAAWGSPSAVLLRCGIETPAVSDLACYTIDGVDWLADQKSKTAVYTTYGRTPGVEVVVDTSKGTDNVLFDLASSIGALPVSKKCQSVSGS